MGQRQACEIAQTCTDILAHADPSSPVKVATLIDNVRFVAPPAHRAELLAVVRRFLTRCRTVNVTINDVDPSKWLPMSDETLWAKRVVEEDFLGERFAYAAGTIQNTASTVEKVRFVMDTLRCDALCFLWKI